MVIEECKIKWNDKTFAKYETMVNKIPIFHRQITTKIVFPKAVENAVNRKGDLVEDQDVIRAFLTEVPSAFYSLMIRLMEDVGFDYKKYEWFILFS